MNSYINYTQPRFKKSSFRSRTTQSSVLFEVVKPLIDTTTLFDTHKACVGRTGWTERCWNTGNETDRQKDSAKVRTDSIYTLRSIVTKHKLWMWALLSVCGRQMAKKRKMWHNDKQISQLRGGGFLTLISRWKLPSKTPTAPEAYSNTQTQITCKINRSASGKGSIMRSVSNPWVYLPASV